MTHIVQNIIETAQATITNNVPSSMPSLGNFQFWEKDRSVAEMKTLLQDINNEKQQMEGLKMAIAAMSKGINMAELFPDVVKLVASQNPEIKRMVYLYLVQYSELEQNAALLAVNILRRNTTDTNQMTRAHALRTISSFRVKMIIPVVVTALVGGVKDSSPYVRKTAAHAIPKIFSVDPSQKEVLIEQVERLLKDRSPMVLGSAVATFNEICPERFDLVHPNFTKFCDLLADVDSWGQVPILNMLTRYGRSQFTDPEKNSGEDKDEDMNFGSLEDLDPDHRKLLECSYPLLSSDNSAVVMAVSTLYYYLAPKGEKYKVGKAACRCIRNNREMQYCILSNILAMANTDPEIFQPYLTDFFVQETDPTFVRKLKIEIMTLLSNPTNIDRILREFSYYSTKEEKEFVAGTIQAIGKCAMRIPEVLDRCMIRLLQLLTVKSPSVVAEAVVVIKQLLQLPTTELSHNDDVVKQLTRLFSKVEYPKAKAAIIWVVGEYLDKVGKYAPDILRQLAKDFITLDDSVKLQVLNLSAKLMIKIPEQTALISQYIFHLAKYDMNYDIRDRARLIRHLLFNQANLPVLSSKIQDLFITVKPSPVPTSYDMRFMIGSLAQAISQTTPCYNPISDWSDQLKNQEERKVAEPEYVVTAEYNKMIGIGGNTTELGGFGHTTTLSHSSPSKPPQEFGSYESWLTGDSQNEEYPPEEQQEDWGDQEGEYPEEEYPYDENGGEGEYYEGDGQYNDQGYYEGEEYYEGEGEGEYYDEGYDNTWGSGEENGNKNV